MAYDKSWAFSLNQNPSDQSTLQKLCQSFLYQLKTFLMSAGWSVTFSSNNHNFVLPISTYGHTTTLLSDGRLLVVGGCVGGAAVANTYFGTISGNTITWVAGTPITVARYDHTTSVLSDGRVLVTCGMDSSKYSTTYFGTISGNTITWVAGTAYIWSMSGHTATVLGDGRILIAMGSQSAGAGTANTYFGTISGNTISWVAGTAYPSISVFNHSTVLLPDGRILVCGGANGSNHYTNTTFGTISGNTITWVAGTAMPVGTDTHTTSILADGRMLICGGTNGSALSNTYFGTIAGTVITWAAGTSLPIAAYDHTATVLGDGRVFVIGGWNGGTYFANCYFITISSNTLIFLGNDVSVSDNWSVLGDIGWNTSTMFRSFILLSSPEGMVSGPSGSYTGAQSKLYLCLEAVGSATTDYHKINLTLYATAPTVLTSGTVIPVGGQSIAANGAQFINASLVTSRFHFSKTPEGGFYAGISANGTGIMSTLMYVLPLTDVQKYGAIDYPYAAIMGHYYNYAISNMSAAVVFDAVANTLGGVKMFSHDGTAGTPREMHLYSAAGTAQVPGTGTTAGTGDINGNMLEFPLYIYNATSGKSAMVGRLPDFYGLGGTAISNGSVTPASGGIEQSIIYQLSLPADTNILV